MAEGGSIHQPGNAKSGVVLGSYVYEAPLLPYEKQLIAAIGSTEEEYRQFVGEVIRRSKVRPAGYEHIPDIRCEPVVTPLLVSLAVGILSTAVSYLLMPKPKALGGQQQVTQRQLDSIRGGNRFTPSRGFDTTAELADYNSAIPIIFGLYNELEQVGGLLITPRLVWSRMFSYGRQQSAKLMFVVGEQGKADAIGPDGILPPSLPGVFIGNNALDAIYSKSFAFYWKRNTTASNQSRIRVHNIAFGSNATKESADPNGGRSGSDDDAFLVPTRVSDFEQGFCHSYTPSNNTEFGVYSPIANGTNYRVNWRVISIPRRHGGSMFKNDPGGVLRDERKKICGEDTDDDKMEGTGRNYSRRMGITHKNGVELSGSDFSKVETVNVGDVVEFFISDTELPEDMYGDEVTVDDINNEVESQQIAADDAMQIGELFSIGSVVFQVTGRDLEQYKKGDGDQKIFLKCIETADSDDSKIGIVNKQKVVRPSKEINDENAGIGAGFFPIMRTARGLVRNTRACDVTEIGLKSVVFQRLNGICNFMSLPSANQLEDLDEDLIQLSSGTLNTHIARSSVFCIYVRQAGLDASGNEFSFEKIDLEFVVTGNKPTAQYNFIRLHHPAANAPNEYEYKFVPRSGADLRERDDSTEYVQLGSASSSVNANFTKDVPVPSYGTFRIATTGRLVDKATIRANKEFFNNPRVSNSSVAKTFPEAVSLDGFLPDEPTRPSSFLAGVDNSNIEVISNPSSPQGRMGAFTYAAFGDPSADGTPVGGTKTFRTIEFVGSGRWVEVEFVAEKVELDSSHPARQSPYNQVHVWRIGDGGRLSINIVRSSVGWSNGETLELRRGLNGTDSDPNSSSDLPSSNPFAAAFNLKMAGYKVVANSLKDTVFPQGRNQGYFQEIFGDANNKSIGDKATPYTITKTGKKIQATLNAEVVSTSNHWTGRQKIWALTSIDVNQNSSVTDSTWTVGEFFEDEKSVSAGNLFALHYQNRKVGARFKIDSIKQTPIAAQVISGDRQFEGQSQYADISMYADLVQKSNANEPEHNISYVNEIIHNDTAPLYEKLTTAGLVLRASNTFARLDQLRVWLSSGLQVARLHPDVSTYNDPLNTTSEGPSNLFTDLVFFLLTNFTGGAGAALNMSATDPNLINRSDFEKTSRFLRANKLFCNGAITEKTNIRDFISDNAPAFLCNFVISNGKFSLLPALPVEQNGEISTKPVQIKQLFTSGNILEDTFELEFLGAEERRNFIAVVRYRYERQNKLPEERTLQVELNSSSPLAPVETFDLTQFCTSREHAFMAAKYFLAIREKVGHTITFGTTINGLDLAPGDFIKVVTEASPYDSATNGSVSSTGVITSVSSIADGQHPVSYYKPSSSYDVLSGTMPVSGGVVTDSTFFDSIFTFTNSSKDENVYLVEQLTFEQDMTIKIVASEYPCDSAGVSELAKLVVDDTAFKTQGPS